MERNFAPLVYTLFGQRKAWLKWLRSVDEGEGGAILDAVTKSWLRSASVAPGSR